MKEVYQEALVDRRFILGGWATNFILNLQDGCSTCSDLTVGSGKSIDACVEYLAFTSLDF